MSDIYLMQRTVTIPEKVLARLKSEYADELQHVRSEKKKEKMEAQGWHEVARIHGFNMSIYYERCQE